MLTVVGEGQEGGIVMEPRAMDFGAVLVAASWALWGGGLQSEGFFLRSEPQGEGEVSPPPPHSSRVPPIPLGPAEAGRMREIVSRGEGKLLLGACQQLGRAPSVRPFVGGGGSQVGVSVLRGGWGWGGFPNMCKDRGTKYEYVNRSFYIAGICVLFQGFWKI